MITVAGDGLVTTTPNRADFWFGVQAQRQTAKAATAAAAVEMRRVIDALQASGIAARDIQTAQVSISPQYSSGDVVGYVASNSVTAKVRDVAKAGAVVDAAVEAGATNVSGPSLIRSDRQGLARNALRAAVADARAKAQAIATASGASLGRVVSVIEHGAITPTYAGGTSAGGTTGGTASVPTPVQPGEQSIEATVSVTFAAG